MIEIDGARLDVFRSGGDGGSLERLVDDIERVRRHFALPRWVFWGRWPPRYERGGGVIRA